jgi:hypothetical protein
MASLLRIISISINRVLGKIFAGASAFMMMFIIMAVERSLEENVGINMSEHALEKESKHYLDDDHYHHYHHQKAGNDDEGA